MQIEIDFQVFKSLTARRRSEAHSYNDVLREILGLDGGSGTDTADGGSPAMEEPNKRSFRSRELELPHGTELRAVYKGTTYRAKIEDGRWLDDVGREHGSPSAAARHITDNNVNGLRFWHGKRPGDTMWYTLEVIGLLG